MKLLFTLLAAQICLSGQLNFSASATRIQVFDFVEVMVHSNAAPANPFTTFALRGTLHQPNGQAIDLDGFCDSSDGSTHRIRFLAREAGNFSYDLQFDNGVEKSSFHGTFEAVDAHRKGLLRVDPDYPFHFVWSGTGDHYFWSGLTTYALLGWKDDDYIGKIIQRVSDYKVNRLRVSLIGPRVEDASRWYEPVKPSDRFQFLFGPWPAKEPANIHNPQWDVTRFDTEFFRKGEKAILQARQHDVIISVVFFLDGEDAGADPFGKANMFSPEALRYYRYVNARFGGYSNVTWDLTNEWHLFRNAWWVERMGTYMRSIDAYHHLLSTHGRGDFPWAISEWPDFALYQIWDGSGSYEPMFSRRFAQLATGHPLPQINEEYGYEDTYPVKWGGNVRPPSRNAESRRRLAWDISMAGCYQTTGEKASRNGDGNAPATPSGWINGGFDDSMHLLDGYRRLVDFFESFPYWRLTPVGNRVLAEEGVRYVVYVPDGKSKTVALSPGRYAIRQYDPRSGAWSDLGQVEAATWSTPARDDSKDFAYLLEKGLEKH